MGFRRAKTPTNSTYSKLFRRLELAQYEAALRRWLQSCSGQNGVVIVDGNQPNGQRRSTSAVAGNHRRLPGRGLPPTAAMPGGTANAVTVDEGHGRIEKRTSASTAAQRLLQLVRGR
jgi:hypothetical protein